MRKTLLIAASAAIALGVAENPSSAQRGKRKIDVGVVLDGECESGRAVLDAIKKQVTALAGEGIEIRFPADKLLDGGFDAAKIKAALDNLLGDPEVEVIYALGVLASADVSRRPRLAKPVIAPFVVDRKVQGMPFEKGASGRKNLSYIDWSWSVERDLEVLVEVAGTERVVFVTSDYFVGVTPGLGERAVETAKKLGIELSILGVKASAEEALAALPAGTTAVYLGPLEQLSAAETQRFIDGLTKRKVATFAMHGEAPVRAGALVGRRPKGSLDRLARRVAVNTQRIISGDDPGRFSVALRLPERLIINLKTARAIGLSPSWAVLTEAELVDVERKGQARRVSLDSVIEEALEGNVNIKALEQSVVAGRAGIRSARANLLPQLEASTNARLIDRDRARAGFGNSPQVLWTGDLTVNQVLWSERGWAGLSAEKRAQRGREHELVTTQWDVAAEVGVAYLNVLRTKTAERIRRNTLKLTRTNLELAQTRLDAGSSTQADVFRWEAQIANDRKALIEAVSLRNVAEIDLQRILHRPLEESFATAEADLGSPEALASQRGLFEFIGDPWTFRLFRRFMVEEAVRRSPEIKQLDSAIAAQKRLLKSAKRAPYSPTLFLSGGATQRLYKGGAGTDPLPTAPATNGFDWFVSLNLSLPLYSGGARYAEIDRNAAEVTRLRREREAIRDRVAQRAASTLHLMGASFAGIKLSRKSTEAARKNYELVAASYAQGAVRIVDLLDAQNAWVTADQVAADSVYNFLIDAINVQRTVGGFALLMSDAEHDSFMKRAAAYIADHKQGGSS